MEQVKTILRTDNSLEAVKVFLSLAFSKSSLILTLNLSLYSLLLLS